MKHMWIFVTIAVCLCGMVLILLPSFNHVVQDNETPAQVLIAHRYHQEEFYTAQAAFHVRNSFHDVYAKDLAKEYNFSLECKRMINNGLFYYLLLGNGYQCYIFVDENDVVQEVLVTDSFPSEKEVRNMISVCASLDIPYPSGYNIAACELPLKTEENYIYTEFILQVGVLIVKSPWGIAAQDSQQEFYFYSDDEWASVCDEWDGYTILQIDKNVTVNAS